MIAHRWKTQLPGSLCSLVTAAGCDKRVPGRGLLGGAGLDQGGGGGGGGGGLAAAGPHLTCGW